MKNLKNSTHKGANSEYGGTVKGISLPNDYYIIIDN